jgi:hypothetical protein
VGLDLGLLRPVRFPSIELRVAMDVLVASPSINSTTMAGHVVLSGLI